MIDEVIIFDYKYLNQIVFLTPAVDWGKNLLSNKMSWKATVEERKK